MQKAHKSLASLSLNMKYYNKISLLINSDFLLSFGNKIIKQLAENQNTKLNLKTPVSFTALSLFLRERE